MLDLFCPSFVLLRGLDLFTENCTKQAKSVINNEM